MNIYLCGVGGQGIGLLSTVLARACLSAGHAVRGCDTHGLAQRHGSVSSHLRLGEDAFTPLVSPGRAHLVVALERLEALRAARRMLALDGTLVYYDTVYQPIHVRLGRAAYPTPDDLAAATATRRAHLERVFCDDLPDSRMQNVALLGRLSRLGIVPGVTPQLLEQALDEVVPKRAREANRAVYRQMAAG